MSDRTMELILGLDPAVQRQAYTLVVMARYAGIPLVIISGRRTPEENRRVGGSPNSYHLSGLAFDVAVQGYTRDQIPYEWWAGLGEWAERNLSLSWGGRFVHAGERDVNHFDARGLYV